MVSVGCALTIGAQPADSLRLPAQISDTLTEISVVGMAPRRLVKADKRGKLAIDARLMGESPGLSGAADPVALLRGLPSVSTNGELKAALNVRGSHNGANLFTADGARIVNPMHMLGLYSTFNSSFFSGYEFLPSRHTATDRNATSAIFNANSPVQPIFKVAGEVTAGIIESHAGLHIPVFRSKGALSFGARQTYLHLLFPDILDLGTSRMNYGFTDINAAYTHFLNGDAIIKASFFANKDKLNVLDRHNGNKDGKFGWGNMAASLSLRANAIDATFSYSRFRNQFKLAEAGRALDLPSSLSQYDLNVEYDLGDWKFSAEAIVRHSSGQTNTAEPATTLAGRATRAFEGNIAAGWSRDFHSGLDLTAGARIAVYSCRGWTVVVPMPRFDIGYSFATDFRVYAACGRYVKFDRLVEESSTGLPADFYVNCTESMLPEESWSGEVGLSWKIPLVRADFTAEIYAKRLLHSGEFAGSILDLLNSAYDPLPDCLDGKGYAYGLSVSISRQFGPLRGRVGYNFGKSRLKFDRYGNTYFPSSYDRTHDLSATLLWNPWRKLTVGATYTHATGTPYTKAKYGYIIGENLICEYYPHNSSRLPSYNRLDLSATLKFGHHSVNLSVYNALSNKNILFLYTSYSLSEGITRRESVMKAVIPSISYSFQF